MTGYAAHSWADTLLVGAVDVLVWSVLAAALTLLFRRAFGRKHCPGCSCRARQRAERECRDIEDEVDSRDCWPATPTAVLGEGDPDPTVGIWAPGPGRHRTT